MKSHMKISLAWPQIRKVLVFCTLAIFLLAETTVPAQQQSQQTEPSQSNQQNQQQQQDQNAPEAGGPTGDTGAIAIPKKKEKEEAPPPPPEPKVKNPPGLENYSLRVNVPVVNVDVGVVLEKTHQFVPNLQKDNFRVYEDGVPQQITDFRRIQAPITAVLLVEFASTSWWFIQDMENAAYTFAQQLKPDDYIAVVMYDMHTQILTDFTQDKRLVYQALNSLTIPTWQETNLFDALYETLDRLSRVDGRKYVILISSGRDTFSKINLDKVLQKIKATPNVTIFSIGTGQTARIMADSYGMMGPIRNLDYLQADNQMTTFARMTGGMAFFPRFEGEMPDIFHQINESIRNEYVLSYHPTNQKLDGTYRKIRVELVDNEGHPLRMQDEKHKPLKYDIIARDGYRAKQEVE
jgi:VWFA-related protein